jgi:hypothetical protein
LDVSPTFSYFSLFGSLVRLTSAVPTSPRKGFSARLRREAEIELCSSTRPSSPRNRGPRTPKPQPASLSPSHSFLSSLPLISFLSLQQCPPLFPRPCWPPPTTGEAAKCALLSSPRCPFLFSSTCPKRCRPAHCSSKLDLKAPGSLYTRAKARPSGQHAAFSPVLLDVAPVLQDDRALGHRAHATGRQCSGTSCLCS